jgi:hypothetical protein
MDTENKMPSSYAVLLSYYSNGTWSAYIPSLIKYGAVAWATTKEQAVNLLDVKMQEIAKHITENELTDPEMSEFDQQATMRLQTSLEQHQPEFLQKMIDYDLSVGRGEAPARVFRFDIQAGA